MTINANYSGNLAFPIHQELTSSSVKIGDTAPNPNLTVSGWMVANDTASPVDVCVYHYVAATTTEWLVYRKSLPAADTISESSQPIRLATGDEIRAKGAADTFITVTFSFNFQTTSMG